MLKIYFFERERESRLLPKEGGGRGRRRERLSSRLPTVHGTQSRA